MKANRINFEISPSTLKEVIDAIDLAMAKLEPLMLEDITRSDLEGYARMGDANYSFVSSILDHAITNENLVPRYHSLEAARKDKKYYDALREIGNRLDKLNATVTMNRELAGVELLDFSNDVYNSVKRLYQSGDPEVMAVFPALKSRFTRPRKKLNT